MIQEISTHGKWESSQDAWGLCLVSTEQQRTQQVGTYPGRLAGTPVNYYWH